MRAALARRVQDQLPALGGLDRIARAIHREVRDSAQASELLDRLVGWAVFAEADRIMRHDEDRSDPHERCERRQSLSLSRARLRPPGNIHRPSRFRLTRSARPRFAATSFEDFAIPYTRT
jgi:hypothetical protein